MVGGCVKHEPQEFLPGQDLLHHPHSFMGEQKSLRGETSSIVDDRSL